MTGTWSQRIEQRYALQLPADVRAWLDERLWAQSGGAEFCRARTPQQLLEPEPGSIWAGFMMPDTLPLIGNDYGDWLCLRIAADGSVSELIHWSHCGGDWIPCGRSLAEALLYDVAQHLRDPHKPHVADSEFRSRDLLDLARWAIPWLRDDVPRAPFGRAVELSSAGDRSALFDVLEQWRVAEFAVQRDRMLEYLSSPLKEAGDPALADRLGVTWEPDFVCWLFDTELVPEPQRRRLQQTLGADGQLFTQNWPAAELAALDVIGRRNDLGWAYDIAGWAAQRRGDIDHAVRHYLAGIQASWFSDDTVRFRTHWFEEGYGKFAAFRLATLSDHLNTSQRDDPYIRIFLDNDADLLRRKVHDYWMERARRAESRGNHAQAYECYYRAGWDLGLQPIEGYDEIYDGLRRSATSAACPALTRIAQLHRAFL